MLRQPGVIGRCWQGKSRRELLEGLRGSKTNFKRKRRGFRGTLGSSWIDSKKSFSSPSGRMFSYRCDL
ncbi:MAG TPA: hypothetical protein VM577_09415, partial [Anaerovoracaceae bacterium]|nr:hypothetical protein [Anaerovoracaceae bacterium]